MNKRERRYGGPDPLSDRAQMMLDFIGALVPCPRCDGRGQLYFASNSAGVDVENCFLCHRITMMFVFEMSVPLSMRPYGKTTKERADLWKTDRKMAFARWFPG